MTTTIPTLETLCNEINQMAVPSRIHAIELILRSIDNSVSEKNETPHRGG